MRHRDFPTAFSPAGLRTGAFGYSPWPGDRTFLSGQALGAALQQESPGSQHSALAAGGMPRATRPHFLLQPPCFGFYLLRRGCSCQALSSTNVPLNSIKIVKKLSFLDLWVPTRSLFVVFQFVISSWKVYFISVMVFLSIVLLMIILCVCLYMFVTYICTYVDTCVPQIVCDARR